MPCPHNEITIVQRSQRQSAVAAAAYQSGEKLFCEYDQQVKHYPEKRGIVHNEILLPANAPPEYADRNTLDPIRQEQTDILKRQLARGNNGSVKTKYITYTIEADNLKAARARLSRISLDIQGYFKIMGAVSRVLDGKERL